MTVQLAIPQDVVRSCANCPPKPRCADLDWYPHPGFGYMELTCDGETPDWWAEFEAWPTVPEYWFEWYTIPTRFPNGEPNPRGGRVEFLSGEYHWALTERLQLRDIEECVREDPDHDWRLRIEGPLAGQVYQRQFVNAWVCIENLEGFA